MRSRVGVLLCCITLAACGIDATQPPALLKAVDAARDVQSATWNMTFLDPSSGYVQIDATAINNRGDIAGVEIDAFGKRTAFVERNGQRDYLVQLGGHTDFVPTAINDAGVLVGSALNPGSSSRIPVVYWESDRPAAIPGVQGVATDVNDTGWIIGREDLAAAPWQRAFVWRRGWSTARVLGDVPNSVPTRANSVNNAGYVAGCFNNAPAVWMPNGSLQRIPLADRVPDGCAEEINDALQVVGTVGYVVIPPTLWGGRQGFRWTSGKPMEVLLWHPDLSSLATDIDKKGRVYGFLKTDDYFAAVWFEGAWRLLHGPIYGGMLDANDCGSIVAPAGYSSILWRTDC